MSLTIKTPLRFLDKSIGDNFTLTSRVYSLTNHDFSIKGYEINFEDKTIAFDIDEGFGRGAGALTGFILDDPYWGLLDQAYNALY